MNFELVFQSVKDSFCSLWTFKIRGSTLEIITPFSTTNNKFISVFVTQRDEKIIVTDGGWLINGEYDTKIDFDDEVYGRIFSHYETQYEISSFQKQELTYYFKSTKNLNLVPNLVYDLSHFLSAIVSTSQIQFHDEKEKQEREHFRKAADNYLSGLIPKDNIKFRKELGEGYKNVKFNAVVTKGSKISLVKYITGSTPNYFMGSLTKATVDFEIANHSPYNNFIDKRVALLNDTAPGYDPSKIFRYIETLEEHTKRASVPWTQKNILDEIL